MIHDKHNLQHIVVKDCFKSMYFIRYFPINVYFIRKLYIYLLLHIALYCFFEGVGDKRSVKKLDGKGEGMGSVGNIIWSFHGRQLRGYTIQGSFV